jgi:hypothetical protein
VQIVTARSHHLDLVTAFGRRSDIRLYRRGESVIADIGGTEIHVDEEGIPRFLPEPDQLASLDRCFR